MKTNILFKQLARAVLILVIACSFLAMTNRAASAKTLAGTFTTCAAQTQIPAAECEALVAVYTNMGGAGWVNHTDWLQTDIPCSWFGVSCAGGTHVTNLYLKQNNLSGPIPSQLASLTQLTELSLIEGALGGSIPPELGSLTNLTELYLCGIGLNGRIPAELGSLTNLTTLDFSDNALSGPIPTWLGSLTNLTWLGLSGNTLTGSIPPELGSLTQLTRLDLYDNALTGPIPPELGSLTNLATLAVSNNQLTGSIPAELGNLTKLTTLDLSVNALTGSIPPELGNPSQLYWLLLENNALSGVIPPELGSLAALAYLDLSDNQLTGSIPAELGSLSNLFYLYLNDNRLSGEFPASIVNLVRLRTYTDSLRFDCELTSSDPDVIAFIDTRAPGWRNKTCPTPVSPSEGAVMDNGRADKLDDIVWDFDWSDVPGATKYHLFVTHLGAPIALINKACLAQSSYHHLGLNSYITEANRRDWRWQVRAYANGQWGEWSQLRTFSVEPLNTDAPQALARNGGLDAYLGASRIPTYWKAVNFSATDGKTAGIKQGGAASVKISGAAGRVKTLLQPLNVSGPAGDLLIFSYWVKGAAIPAAGVCQGQVLFYGGGALKGVKTLKCPAALNYGFTKMTLNISAPAAYDKVMITFTYGKPGGAVWFDTVSLIR